MKPGATTRVRTVSVVLLAVAALLLVIRARVREAVPRAPEPVDTRTSTQPPAELEPVPAAQVRSVVAPDPPPPELAAFVSGVVRDGEGAPVAGARLEFHRGARAHAWVNGDLLLKVRSDAQGRFELRDAVEDDELGMRTTARGFVEDWRLVTRGTERLEVVLARGGWIDYDLRYDGYWRPSLELEPHLATTPFSDRAIGPITPGVYTVKYTQLDTDIEGDIPGVVVVAGGHTRDPRLNPLDLRGRVPTVALTVVDEEGARVPEPVFAIGEHVPFDVKTVRARSDGERWLLTAGPLPLHLWIEATGWRRAELVVDADRRVVLERGPRVRWVVAGSLPELPGGWRILGVLHRRGPFGLVTPAPTIALDGGVQEFFVSSPGTYEASYDLVRTHAGVLLGSWGFGEDDPPAFEIVDGSAVQVLRVPAPSSELEAQMRATIDAER